MLFAHLTTAGCSGAKLSESAVSAGILGELVSDTGKSQVLKHGIDLKKFNHLSTTISTEEVARIIDMTKSHNHIHVVHYKKPASWYVTAEGGGKQ